MEESGNRAEAIRLLGIAEKLLQSRDFNGSRDFAILAQETEPLIDLSGGDRSNQSGKLPVSRRGPNQDRGQYWMPNTNAQKDNQRSKTSTFWTACPYCYRLFEYPRVYEGFVPGSPESEGKAPTGFPNWMHPTFSEVPPHQGERNGGYEQPSTTAVKVVENKSNVAVVSGGNVTNSGPRKRGRPRKIPL
ncbi:hypothetical protein F3Y22_tig00110160pilonHSYRG00742 [Hibiscus syriacus]|uniref:Uncharacterized protein n=1 Tax=Hibiscus syriacus TaxID=106335 RepID=A0A6A3BIH5_HIBSY|nr:hypothetical protein F3Y22_tig00110160pilonHSYRG00742 [Hibiscus syriacus]